MSRTTELRSAGVLIIMLFAGLVRADDGMAQPSDDSNHSSISSDVPYIASGRIQSVRRTGHIVIDGKLAERDWLHAPVISDFTQSDPDQGAVPTERTEVRVVYDNAAIYISARLYDSAPDSIVARLGRRDVDEESDHFVVFLDPFFDRRSGYYFGINAAGTLYDGVLMNDDWDDSTWDGVWLGKARIDERGWTVEMRIPFSQLRFHQQDIYTWGINFRRGISRRNETDYLVYTPRNESGFVSRFRELSGIEGVVPKRQVEITPYLTTRAEFTHPDGENPFNDGSEFAPEIGADFKIGLTSNLTLNATVNPDFGQVEVDPAVVNLSDVETFFPEQRPFFVEGASIIDGFGQGGSNSNWSFNWGNPNFFYSRRIGRPPQGSLPAHDYVDHRDGARILGAAKLSGRLGAGWNVGSVQAVTGRESARFVLNGLQSNVEVEPLTWYGITRVQREFNEGRQAFGFLSTVTQRAFQDNRLRGDVNSSSYGTGVDGYTFLDGNKMWVATGWLGLTHVRGNSDRILRLQQSSLHYFQRPDANAVSLDSLATSMTGMAGRILINKQRGRLGINTAIGFISPSYDVNDLGFMWQTNVINAHVAVNYQWTEPTNWYRSIFTALALFGSNDFDGNTTWAGVWAMANLEFLNYFRVNIRFAANPETVSNRRTRGGPLTLNQPGIEYGFRFNSDGRRSLVLGLNLNSYVQKDSWNLRAGSDFQWNAAPNLSLSVSPQVSWNSEFAQWVGAFEDPSAMATFGRRYIFAELDQRTLSSSIRLNWTFTPTLSLQLFAQPLISAGSYADYKELAAPKTYSFNTLGEGQSTLDTETLVADPDGDGPSAPIQLPKQDFNFKSLRGTSVLRWEFQPGSTLFLVWTQSRTEIEDVGTFHFRDSVSRLLDANADNIFMIKFSYWFSR